MELSDILLHGKEAKAKLISGINKVADAVKITMGPGGKTVILGDPSGNPVVTKDGVSVAKYIKLIDPIENMGAQLMKQASSKTVSDVGDGTTTSTVLAQAFMKGAEEIKNVTQFRRGMERAKQEVINYLEEKKEENLNKDLLYNIALTSSNGDIKIAELVSDVADQVGKEGIINVINGEFDDTKSEVSFGYRLSRGYLNSYFINKPETGTCELEGGGYVIMVNNKLESFDDLIPLLKHTKSEGKFILVIAREFSDEVILNAQRNFSKNHVKIVPIIAEDFGDRMLQTLEDLAIYTDGEVITPSDLKAGTEAKIGFIDSIKVSPTDTTIFSDSGKSRTVVRIKQLQNLIKESKSKFDTNKLKSRIAKLSAGVGTIIVGGLTESETKERFDRYEDAVGAVLASLSHGVLPGGGIALYSAFEDVSLEGDEYSIDFVKGFEKVQKNLSAPYFQILENADIDLSSISKDNNRKFETGIDALTGEEVNMYDAGIIDPYKVTISALSNAVSISSMILSTGCVIESNMININND